VMKDVVKGLIVRDSLVDVRQFLFAGRRSLTGLSIFVFYPKILFFLE
jgi:hypothetical protein